MKLVLAIVNGQDSKEVIKRLMSEGFHVTKLASSGGFLLAKNVTLLMGVSNERVEYCLSIIKDTCSSKTYNYKNMTPESSSFIKIGAVNDVSGSEIKYGGATVFVMDIENYSKF